MTEGEDRGLRLTDKTLNFVAQTERIRPLRDQIIVKPIPLRFSDSIKAEWQGGCIYGEVVAAGPGCFPNIYKRGFKAGKDGHKVEWRTVTKSKVFRRTEVKVGDKVHLGFLKKENGEWMEYLFPHIWVNGDWCVRCQEADVCAIEYED